MKKIHWIFDYFKQAFHINRTNKILYIPQIIFIAVKLLMIMGIGVAVYTGLGQRDFYRLIIGDFRFEQFFPMLVYGGISLLMMGLIYMIISRIVEAGLYNMYKQSVMAGTIETGAFGDGVRKYFFSFLLGDILIFIAWVIFLPFYFIAGIVTLTVGFAIIPLIINIFLTMWKVSLVMNDSGLFTALGDSFRFANHYFFPLTILQFIHWSFVKGIRGGGNRGNYGLRWTEHVDKVPQLPFWPGSISNQQDIVAIVINFMKIAIAVLVPVVTIATAVAALIKMIFEVFFSLVIFIAYHHRFGESRELIEREVIL
ncbi:MAG: hypothetical protein PWP27_1960 [Clostridiales bacterium]|nr:hypothetical protein [Clostridiales bacterium]